uniref:jerky protein homolog-like n=1 Tax=Centroberyx gerrardi TaxID=166262 RepID=UPI003AAF228D
MADLPVAKRKRVAHSIELKLEILAKLDQGVKITSIAKEYNIAKATVCEIKKGKAKIEKFASEVTDSNTLKNRCVVRKAEDEDFDRALHQWFMQERGRGAPISGPTLMEKAKLMYEEMYPDRRGVFKASTGWLYRFKNRHGIQRLKSKQGSTLCVETDATVKTLWDNGRSGGQGLSVQKNTAPSCLSQAIFDASNHFKHTMAKFVEENRLTPDQVFNADEVGLYWRLLPGKILSDGSARQQAKNVKASKDRVTLMAAANASGDLRLPLVFVHRSAKPSCFTSTAMSALPCHYYSQSSAWLDGDIFSDWFEKHFVPLVSQYLRGKGLPVHAALLLDTVRSHPAAGAYVSETEDGSMQCVFVPSKDALIGAAVWPSASEKLRRLYKKDLLGRLLLGKQSMGRSRHGDPEKGVE